AQAATTCPTEDEISPCRCSLRGDEIQIWCSHSELPSVLAALRNVARLLPTRPLDELILENNAWTSLGGAALAGPTGLRVSRLMLRDNGLETVAATWLAGLEDSLLELFLVEPLLRAFPDDSLTPFKRLEAVTLQCGEMQRLPRLAGLPRLRYVLVQSAMLWEVPPGHLANLPYLEQLHVVSSPRLASLDAGSVSDLPRLSAVNISDSGLTWIHPRALQRLPALAEVTLRGNKLSDAAMVGRALHDLPSLAALRLDDNALEILPSASFADLPALRELSLAGNKIIELQHGAFQRLPALRNLDLSRNQVRVIHPEAFLHHSTSNLDQLYLQENSLDSADAVRAVLESLPRLRFLDVSDNNIVEIGMGALGRGHGSLERLHLDRNRVHRVFRDSFNNMPSLRELRLSHNMLSNNLDQPYWNLPALKGLDLSYNQFRRCDPRLLANLPSLRRLDLSGNNIAHVDPGSFLNTPALEHVNLSSNALAMLSPATFRMLLNLFELDVGRNRLSHMVPGLPPGVEYLRMAMNQVTVLPPPTSPDMNLPALRLLDLSNNGLKRVSAEAFRQMPGLQQLMLSGNALQTLETGSLSGLNRLERLELRGNRLTSLLPRSLQDQRLLRELDLRGNRLEVLPADVLQEASSLQTLDLSRNQLASIEPDAMRGNRNLEVFRASHNALPNIPSALLQLSSLRVLDLSHNRVRELAPGALAALAGLQELRLAKNKLRELRAGAVERLPRLQVLDLDSNELHNLQPRAIHSLPALQQLNLARNRLQTLSEGALSDVANLMQCDLQENQLSQVSAGALAGAPHLLHLNMSYNQIAALENAGLQRLRSLEVLDLSHNRVSRVAADTLDAMEWLVELKMDNNRICNIQGVPFNNMPRLRVLSLNNNKMTSLPETTFQRLKNSVAQLQLNGNPLSCSCDLLWLHSWLLESEAEGQAGQAELQAQSADGPRCADGSLVKEIRVSRAECDAAAKSAPMAARHQGNPACDAEIIDLPPTNAIGPSQIVSTALEVRGSTPTPQQNVAPSPEESEYFYDDYVEYQVDENATAINNASLVATPANVLQQTTASLHQATGPTTTSKLRPPGGLGPGMTPADDPKRMPPGPPGAAGAPGSGGLTFFGIPLKMPSLNIGGIFGHARDADGKPVASRNGELEHGKAHGTVSRVEPTTTTAAPSTATAANNQYTVTAAASTTTDPAIEVEQAVIYNLGELAHVSQGRTPPSPETSLSDITASTVATTFSTSTEEETYDWTTASPLLERPGSALSALLAPGGQLPGVPETHSHSHSRSSVTRVAMAPGSGAGLAPGPAPGPASDDPQSGAIPRSAKGPHYYYAEAPGQVSGTPQKQISRETHNWYFENYNRTNLQPFVGPGSEAYSRSRSSNSSSSLTALHMASFLLCSLVSTARMWL
ncbi:protein artichoke, partial [Thrips palmi]|uniref:Protein artichoke n=1 Tax=Thrips palmi TaxID=161013 RepID=A0A6P8YCX1_THRPL